MTKSSLPKEIPALNACLKPKSFNLSQKMTVVFCPQNLNTMSITSETTFLGNNLSTKENLISLFFGKRFANKNLSQIFYFLFHQLSQTSIQLCYVLLVDLMIKHILSDLHLKNILQVFL